MEETLYDISFERSLLSSIIFEPTIFEKINESLNYTDFYLPQHQIIFNIMTYLNKNNKPIDEEFIKKELIKIKKFDEQTMLEIISANPISNTTAYVNEIKNKSLKRQILLLTTEIKKITIEEELSNNEVINIIEKKLYDITNKQKISTNLFSITKASDIEPKESEFITSTFIPVPKKTVTIFSAGGGTGKTLLLLQLAMRFLHENPYEKAFCWLSEDPLSLTKFRLNQVIKNLFKEGYSTLDRLELSEDMTYPVLLDNNRSMTVNHLFYKMKSLLNDYKLLIFDPLIAFYGADENNNAHAKLFMQLFTHWAAEEDKVIIFIHHSTKNTSQSRGASAFVDAARAVYEIEKIKDKDGKETESSKRKVTLTKDNYRASKHFGGFTKEIQVFSDDKNLLNKYNPPLETIYTYSNDIDDELGII